MANQDFDHGKASEHISDLLQSVDRPGDYCVGGKLYVPMPRITIDRVGTLSFPVPQVQIDTLIDVAERAPYGKGTKTLMDTTVRDCWQIDADQVRVTGSAWADTFEQIIDLVSKGLGFSQDQIGAELYKLLVYREGGFFSAHRDTEKVQGMIATLSLSLPTPGEGGELAIRHGGQETVFDMNTEEPSELAYAAFYADCLHEARPVTKGHRISLVFNLFIRSGKKWTGAPDYGELVNEVSEVLVDWKSSNEANKIVWLLDHSYTEDGLSFDTLKGTDAAVARVLGQAAEKANCDMYAAVLYIRETGDPEIDYDYDWQHEPTIGSTIAELHEREEHLENWIARDGGHPPFGELSLADGELIPLGALEDIHPDEEELEDYMGNYGPTLDLIYRLAVLVVWPKAKTLEIVASGGIKNAVSWVATQCNKVSDVEMRRLLSKLADLWPTNKKEYHDNNLREMLRLLGTTRNADIATDFLDRIAVNHYDGSENASLADLLPVVGPETAKKFLSSLIKERMPEHPKEILSLLTLITQNLGRAGLVWRNVLREAAQSALSNLRAVLEYSSKILASKGPRRLLDGKIVFGDTGIVERECLDSAAVRNLFVLAWRSELDQGSINAASTIADFPKIVTPGRMLLKTLADLYKIEDINRTQAYRLLWRQSTDFLLQRSSTPPGEPTNWIINAEIPCTCRLCSELQAFCLHPEANVKRFKVAKDLRKHIHQTIDNLRLDIDHETERKGSPYTLVCVKNRTSYKRRLVEYAEDVRYIGRLLMLVPQGETEEAERVQRLEGAFRSE
jgi:hypothetical protein